MSEAKLELVNEEKLGLQVNVHRHYLSTSERQAWWETLTSKTQWYRVKYKSFRFQNQCETPCWTTFFGGFPEVQPYVPVPSWLQPLVSRISKLCNTPFNAILVRLYFDGSDEIAWHTDGRTFLGPTPTIASLSLGARARFQMRRMNDCWPCTPGAASSKG